ncbi:MAG: D-alanyl-D-alanine carboxypeptidase [Bacilli bacterium]|nr:D-alanyl-D-alanine carboxypeptidase [Bacilli bacterium]
MKKLFLFTLLFIFVIRINAEEIDLAKNAKSAILVETSTGKIIYEKNKNERRSPASMTKIMTLLLTMEALENGNVSLDDKVHISKNAAGMGGTQLFVEEGSEVDLMTLLKGIGIGSANDAAVAVAEYIGGTEENFVSMMNKKAKELGCINTNFKNPHGLDEENHYTTAYDLSLIARELIKYPLALKITSTYEENINVSGENHWLVNTNKLVRFYSGIDGLKTGYTDKALYCLTATMEKNNMRLLSVVMGEDSKDNRNNDTISMMEYGFSMYGSKNILNKNSFEETTIVKNAMNREVKYYLDKDVNLIVNKNNKNVKYTIDKQLYDLKAPLKKGDTVGVLKLKYDNKTYKYNLIVKDDIKKATYMKVLSNLLEDLISGVKIGKD